jgi:uncharacterized protein
MNRRHFLMAAASGVALTGAYPVLIERNWVGVNRYRVALPGLPRAFDGLRIAHLTDLHHGPLVPLSFIRGVVDRTNALGADVIVCTGDYIHEREGTGEIDAVWPELARLDAPRGVFSVLGNHDHWGDTARSVHWLAETGQDLHHKSAAIERDGSRLWLAGAGDHWEDRTDLDGLLDGIPDDEPRIVLAHNPDTADTPRARRADLFVCGHTHGGQVRVPWVGAPVLPVLNKAYASGLVSSPDGTPVFISRGIGWALYPVRFNCPPEIAVLELAAAGSTGS